MTCATPRIARSFTPTLTTGSGANLHAAGVNVNGLVINGILLTIGAGPITAFNKVTLQGYATTDIQLAAAGGTVTGTVSLTTGLAGVLSTIGARGGESGSVQASKTTLQDQIDDLNQRITRYDGTLKQHEDTLRTKFTAMQTMIDKLNSMQTPLNNLAASG